MPQDDPEIIRLTNVIVEELGTVDLDTALLVLSNLCGQIIANISEGRPSQVKTGCETLSENVKKAAIAKMVYDDERRRFNEINADDTGEDDNG